MAAPAKSSTVLITSQPLSASSSITSSVLDMRTYLGAGLTVRVANPNPAPTVGPLITVGLSKDGLAFYQYLQLTGSIAGTTNDYVLDLPEWALYAAITINNPDATATLTVQADAQYISGVS